MRAPAASPWRALRHRNYRLYFAGQALSLIGTWTQQVALSWLVYRLTGSTLLLGTVAFLTQAPQLVCAPFAGTFVDRCDRRRLMLAVQSLMLAQAAALAILAWGAWITPGQIVVAAGVLGILNSLDAPLRHTMVMQLVDDRADLPNAIALNTLSFNVARCIGPPVAGLLVGLTSEAVCFGINGLSFVAVIVALLLIRLGPAPRSAEPFLAAMGAGLRYAWRARPVRRLLLQVAVLNLLVAPYPALMPAIVADVFHGGADSLGLLLGSGGGGALCAALYLAARPSPDGLPGLIARGRLLAAVALVGCALSSTAGLALVPLFFVGFGLIIGNAGTNTVLQGIVPEPLRGRVMALFTSAVLGAAAVGSLAAGTLAAPLGPAAALLLLGLLQLFAALLQRPADVAAGDA